MGSGHTHRKGRGNQRRQRNGPFRPQGSPGQNGHAGPGSPPGGRPASTVVAASSPTEPESGKPPRAPQPAPPDRSATSAPVAPVAPAQDAGASPSGAPAPRPFSVPQQDESRAGSTPPPRQPFEPRHHVPGARPAPPFRSSAAESTHEARNGHDREVAAPPLTPGRRSGGLGPAGEPSPPGSRSIIHHAASAHADGFVVTERIERAEYGLSQVDVRGEVGPLIDSLRDLFQQDRATASTGGATRCGVCYLHFALTELIYREAEGFYVCPRCAQALGTGRIPMVRRQKRL